MPARIREAPFSRPASDKLQNFRVMSGYGSPLVIEKLTKSVPKKRAMAVAAPAPRTV